MELLTSASKKDVLDFYRTELARQHWKEKPLTHSYWKGYQPDLYFVRRKLGITVYVENDSSGQLSTVKLVYDLD